MGFLNADKAEESLGSDGKLDLIEFERKFAEKFNDISIVNTNYLAEEFGLAFDKKNKKAKVYEYDDGETITICPEPIKFFREFDDVSDNTYEANKLFVDKKKEFQKISLDKRPILRVGEGYGSCIWKNKTLTGINLRPGLENADDKKFTPIRMCDDNVHGLIVGRTGSGKSVYINALILSLITEYAPWELDLYLADFKKVELSRYMNNKDEENGGIAYTPQVNACAATSEIRYVTSLIRHLVDCMNARNEFFTRLGVTKIQEFREKYSLVLPRVLLIVDEFQQLFTEATNREAEEIQVMLNSITKLGRATGFHLIFASQEMSGTLRGNTLANFKIRMALPCNREISVDILGNKAAAELERGYVLINTESGSELENIKFRVPFIEAEKKDEDENKEKTPFYQYLDKIKLASRIYDLSYKTDTQKFYREELQESKKDYLNDLDRIREKKNKLVKENRTIYDGIILGRTVLYSAGKNDKVSCYIEKGRNKGVMIATPNPDDAARIRKLLAENLLRSDAPTWHIGMELNNLIWERYRFDKAVEEYKPLHNYQNCDAETGMKCLQMIYYLRQCAFEYLSKKSKEFHAVRGLEEKLKGLYAEEDKVRGYHEFVDKKERLERQIDILTSGIKEARSAAAEAAANPAVSFLERCSADIIMLPKHGTRADLSGLRLYGTIVENFNTDLDIARAAKKNLGLIEKKLEELTEKDNLAILQYKIFQRAILYYLDRYEEKKPQKNFLSDDLEKCFFNVKVQTARYKSEYQARKEADEELLKKTEMLRQKQEELEFLLMESDEIYQAREKLAGYVNNFAKAMHEGMCVKMGVKKAYSETWDAGCEMNEKDGSVDWKIHSKEKNRTLEACLNNILDMFLCRCRDAGTDSGSDTDRIDADKFEKNIFWINGMDEINRISNAVMDIFRTAIHYNILIIAIITSELRDTTIRKAFDYAFVTGNIEKFYSMFDMKYTRQSLDSIVVNFGIRSKGLEIPFKIYKSDLEDVQEPDFIDKLLEES